MRLILALLALYLPSFAFAQDYSPEGCDFSITFPAEPYIEEHCEADQCYKEVSYTKVLDLNTSIKIKVICNPVGDDIYTHYSAEIMKETLKAMTDQSVIQTFDSSFREEEHYKQAGLVGEGLKGLTSTLYIAQLWIAKNSALSIEAELIGDASDEADTLFSDILKSIQYK